METNRLKQYCTIVEAGSMVKASKLVHLTHSALSKSMKILQQQIGIELLCSSGRGIVPTERGLEIYKRVKEFLEHESKLFTATQDTKASNMRIGSVEIFLCCISRFLKQQTIDNNTITLLDLDPMHMEYMIANHQLDYGITYSPFPMENVEMIELGSFSLGCYYLKNTFSGKDIVEIPFIVPSETIAVNPLGIKERDGWIDSFQPRKKKYHVNLLSTALELTYQGLGAVYIPDFLAKKLNETRSDDKVLHEYPIDKNLKIEQRAFLLKHNAQEHTPILKQLCETIKKAISVPIH